MGRSRRKQGQSGATATAPPDVSAGTAVCRFCKAPLPGAAATICVFCFAERARNCTRCLTAKGALSSNFQRHFFDAETVDRIYGKEERQHDPTRCFWCGMRHDPGYSMPQCPKCHNQRYTLDESTPAVKEGVSP